MKILVIEDDLLMSQTLTTILTAHNYAVETSLDGASGLALIENFGYDLIILDIILPNLDGIQVCRQIRNQKVQTPILLLTGRNSHHDRALGLDAGADDYVIKPFNEEELIARIRALLRRASPTVEPYLTWGELRLDPKSCEVTYHDRILTLTPKEYALLELFLHNSHQVFSCSYILEHLWAYDQVPGEEAVRTHIKGLRHKLKAAGAPADWIETVYGTGYRLKPIVAPRFSGPQEDDPSGLSRETELRIKLAQLWQQHQPRIDQQIAQIEQFISYPSQAEARSQAQRQAHTLTGALGTFGFTIGTQLARDIDQLLATDRALTSPELQRLQTLTTQLRQSLPLSSRDEVVPSSSPPEDPVSPRNPSFLIVSDDRALIEALTDEANDWHWNVAVISGLEELETAKIKSPPSAILFAPDPMTQGELRNQVPIGDPQFVLRMMQRFAQVRLKSQ